mgnify:CR=1 FL=1
MLNRLTHTALRLACYRADAAFRGQSLQLEKVQRQKLKQILIFFKFFDLASIYLGNFLYPFSNYYLNY